MKSFSALSELIRKKRSIVLALCSAVVFVTTYLLILPAMTLDEQEAASQGGIDLPTQLQQEVGDVSISASFDAKAGLPEDTELAVSALDSDEETCDALREEALLALQAEDGGEAITDLGSASFYDITLLSEGQPVEPDSAVDVTISFDKGLPVSDAQNLRIVHFGEKKAEVLGLQDAAFEVNKGKLRKASFAAESFSMFAVVCAEEGQPLEETAEAVEQESPNVLTADGKTYDITVTYEDAAQIPVGAELNVREIREGTAEFEEYLTDSAKELDADSEEVSFARFFDIEIVKDGNKIEPRVPVQVKIEYNDAMQLDEDADLNIVHFADDGTEVITDLTVSDNKKELVYEQDSFSVTGTIITTQPESGRQYAVIVKRGDHYYAVLNDGSLLEVEYSESEGRAYVEMEYPMFWTYIQENGHWNLRETSYAATFTYQNLPDKYYYKYIDPNAQDAISEEAILREPAPRPDEVNMWEYNYQGFNGFGRMVDSQHSQYVNDCAISRFTNQRITDDNNQYYIGIDEDNMRIKGRVTDANEAATVFFAEVTSVNPAANLNHTVNHIDISIQGGAVLDVPLAYGLHYYKVGDEFIPLMVTEDNPITLHLSIPSTDPQMRIDSNDMKHAEISAFTPEKGVLSNAFYITGYSQNHGNDQSTPQIRIEGSFKVADLDPYDIPPGINTWQSNWQQLADEALTDEQVHARIENKIYYSVAVKKNVTFVWEYEYAPGQKAQVYDADCNLLTSERTVNLSKSFNYWDSANECPPIIDPNISSDYTREQWQKGHILWDTTQGTGSGMDFKLEAFAQGTRHPAIEVAKYLRTTDGEVLYPKTDLSNQFVVYQKKNAGQSDWDSVKPIGVDGGREAEAADYNDFSGIHALSVTVGQQNGEGLTYDYDISENGMIYVEEDAGSVKQEIVDADGNVWQYVRTRTETEYAWRENGDYSGKRHLLNGFKSCPEVVGHYGVWDNNGVAEPLYNEFLEFYFYNIYEPKTYPVFFTKVDEEDPDDENGLDGASFDLYGPYEEPRSGDEARKQTLKTEGISTHGSGKVKIGDLSSGYYYLYETVAPDNYELLSEPIEIHVDSTQLEQQNAVTVTGSNVDYVTTGSNGEQLDEPYFKFLVENHKKAWIDVMVRKVDMKDISDLTSETLPGAIFTLQKYMDNTFTELDDTWPAQTVSDSEETGLLSFTELTEGYYKLVEVKCPTGYIKSQNDPRFRVKDVNGSLAVILLDDNGQEDPDGVTTTVKVSNESTPVLMNIGNEPGAELPSAGGPGTTWIYLLGMILFIGCSTLLIARRRVTGKDFKA